MADKDQEGDGPSLELPSFSFGRRKHRQPEPVESAASDRESGPEQEPDPAAAPEAETRMVERPSTEGRIAVNGLPAAALTGVVVGGLAVLLGWLAGVGCEAVRGTSACGGGPGLLILLVVLVTLAWAGALLLRGLGVPHAGSTSLLAVGILAVLVLVLLLGSLDEGWVLVAVPVASAIAHAVSWWVTTAVGDDDQAARTSATASSYDIR